MMGMMILYGLKTFAALLKSRKSHLYKKYEKKYEKKYMTSSYLIQKLSYSVGPCPPPLTLASLNDHEAGKKMLDISDQKIICPL